MSLFVVAQVMYSAFLLSREFPRGAGEGASSGATQAVAVVFAFASAFLGFATTTSAFSYTQVICRALETIQEIQDKKEQAHDLLESPHS